MLIKSFVTVTVTTSYRNKNWKSKLRKEGMIQIANFGTRAVVRYKPNKGPKGVEPGCLQMRLRSAQGVSYSKKFCVKHSFSNYLEVAISQFGSAKK